MRLLLVTISFLALACTTEDHQRSAAIDLEQVSSCGNGVCDFGEGVDSCPQDCCIPGQPCGATCGNGICEMGEDHTSCPSDCCERTPGMDGHCIAECGNGFCEVGEDHTSCPADCACEGPNCCGNGVCEFGEGPITCPADCNDRN